MNCAATVVSVIQRLSEIYWKPGKCPEVVKSECRTSCIGDSDCTEEQKCCSTGCGRECMIPVHTASQSTSVPHISITVQPVLAENVTVDKIGFCPPKNSIPNKNCDGECQNDDDCSGVEKCCNNGCGMVCSPPDKTTHCIHLLSAVNRLPKKTLANGYVPNCTTDGSFERVQCNELYCWCVDVTQGWEIPGTSVLKEDGRPNCQVPRECPNVVCLNPCPHGLKTQKNGCPMPNCECKNICDDIQCNNPMEACQLVEPDCAEPPCLPLPRCLLNPCLRGLPMTLPNGVTALCTRSSQCSSNFWCHQIGYNGLGFCCANPESAIREGHCPARIPKQSENCDSECRSDAECKIGSKCCFDGCGLKCLSIGFPPNPFETKPAKWVKIQEQNKRILSSLVAECPENHPRADHSKCDVQCQRDSDCPGMKRCCSIGCSSLCTYPTKTTACIHDVITHEVYKVGRLPKCDAAGNYEQQQCDSYGCFCVNVNTGKLVPFSRQHAEAASACSETPKYLCRQFKCTKNCSYGFEVDEDGCELCDCKNPCRNVECSNNELCIMLPVQCYQKNHCPPQPRCVPNICPTGISFSSFADITDLCSNDSDCPSEYWCNLIGLSGKGFCCLRPKPQLSPGFCPEAFVSMDTSNLKDVCKIRCKSDNDCEFNGKCCFNGCGTSCITTIADKLEPVQPVKPKTNATNNYSADKNWKCPKTKCCNFGCGRICTYPQKAPACIHLKAALQRIGTRDTVNCKHDGSFDIIQCNQNYCWCSTPEGTEIEGTRVSNAIKPVCDSYRLCTEPKCVLNVACPYGRELDINGCRTCRCFNPCKDITCPNTNEFCVPNTVECTTATCLPVPQCVVKACSKSLPVIDEVTFEPLLCKENSQCKYMGRPAFLAISVVIIQFKPIYIEEVLHSGKCPAETSSINIDCIGNCASDEDCLSSEKCCYNGCGLSCVPYAPIRSKTNKIGECLAVTETEPMECISGEEDACSTDEDCPGIQKCCLYGCTKQCSYAGITTGMIRFFLFMKLFKIFDFIGNECDLDGEFYPLQSSGKLRFCVDKKGFEVQGTRSSIKNPNCHLPRSCPISSCSLHCPLGYIYSNGCNQCACHDPCDGVKCLKTQICRVIKRECYTKDCSPFPKCINKLLDISVIELAYFLKILAIVALEMVTFNTSFFMFAVYDNLRFYRLIIYAVEPDPPEECQISPELVIYDSAKCAMHCRSHSECKRGICCFNGCGTYCMQKSVSIPEVKEKKVFSLKHIVDLNIISVCIHRLAYSENAGLVKPLNLTFPRCSIYKLELKSRCGNICTYGVRLDGMGCPMNGVCECRNPCEVSFKEILNYCFSRLERYRVSFSFLIGMFNPVQCDDEDSCWCVDTITGNEFYGTKTKSCSVSCEDRGMVCPFGLETDSTGCALDADCRCRNPCASVQCQTGYVCVLRPRDCSDKICVPVPTCEKNWCANGRKPAVEPRTYTQFTCLENRTQICPSGFYCTGYDYTKRGICCPGQAAESCPHGDAFSNSPDGSPLKCSVNTNGCPSSHYCLSKPTESTGICCVTKRYVCNLKLDSGPCTVSVPRFYYDPENQTCFPFNYGGCSGNLNNFGSKNECERFCVGTGVDPAVLDYLKKAFKLDDKEVKNFTIYNYDNVRFSLYGPDVHAKASRISARKQKNLIISALIAASIVFGVAVCVVLLFACVSLCIFLETRKKLKF
uniref:WAP domain-containing protein n=1 Tax=Syphacia muris TaxID=451379 RepID=A0A158R3Z3_9BILA